MSALSPRQTFLLDMACRPLRQAFPDYGPYMVGTATKRDQPHRDVDVRCIVEDVAFDAFETAIGTDAVTFLGMAIGQYLASLTELPIDFQFQRMTEANAAHKGERHPLGLRTLANFTGDAPRHVVVLPVETDTESES